RDELELDLEAAERATVLDDPHAVDEADGPAEAAPLGVAGGGEAGGAHLSGQHRLQRGGAEDAPAGPRAITHAERGEGEEVTGVRDEAAGGSDVAREQIVTDDLVLVTAGGRERVPDGGGVGDGLVGEEERAGEAQRPEDPLAHGVLEGHARNDLDDA